MEALPICCRSNHCTGQHKRLHVSRTFMTPLSPLLCRWPFVTAPAAAATAAAATHRFVKYNLSAAAAPKPESPIHPSKSLPLACIDSVCMLIHIQQQAVAG
eukprot:1160135-Pelagomonas_calceolata.AAC.15